MWAEQESELSWGHCTAIVTTYPQQISVQVSSTVDQEQLRRIFELCDIVSR